MITFYDTQAKARADATARNLREKAVCLVVRARTGQPPELLVFDHLPDIPVSEGGAGVQLPAGGVEAGEAPEAAAVRELWEESGLKLEGPQFLGSYLLHGEPPEAFKYPVQVCHAYAFAAAADTPDAWQHHADGHVFAFRWVDVATARLDWELDAALPQLRRLLTSDASPLSYMVKES